MKRATFIILCLEGAILSFNVAASAAMVPTIARDFSVPYFFAGNLIWLYMLPYGIAALFYGPMVRFFNARSIELISFFIFSFANLLAALSHTIGWLFIARLLMGISGASVIPLVLILIAHGAPMSQRGQLVGIFFSATFIASLVGLFLSGIFPWRFLYLIPAIAGFILWIFMYRYLPSFQQVADRTKANYVKALKSGSVIGIFTYIFFVSLLYHAIQQWLAVYFFTQFHFGQFLISMLLTLASFSGIFGEVAGGRLSDTIGRIKTVDLGILFMCLSALILMFKIPLVFLALVMVLWGFGWTMNHAGLSTMLTDLPKEFLNEAASLNSSVRFVSGGVGALLGGILMQKNFNTGFLCVGLCLAGLAIFAKKVLIVETPGLKG